VLTVVNAEESLEVEVESIEVEVESIEAEVENTEAVESLEVVAEATTLGKKPVQ
jgi:copper chaperone CopZ